MKVAFKSLVAAATFIAAGSAFAATVNVTAGTTIYKGVKLSGNETLSLSTDALGFLDILQPTITATGAAVVTVDKQDEFTHVNVSATAPLSSLALDNTTQATVTGANGVGTLVNYALWNFNTVEGSDTVIPSTPGTTATTTFKNTVINTSTPLFNTEVTVANNSSNPATGWNVNWRYGKPTLLINVKNARLTNKYLQNYTALPLSTNTMIPAGGSTTFSFRGYASSVIPAISDLSATLGGQACPVVVAP